MNRKDCISRFKPSLPLIFVSRLTSHVSRKRGFTVVEFLAGILISLLILGAISIAFIGANRGFQQNKPISQAIQEAQNSVVTLDFLFSRWGIGVPWLNTIPIYSMDYDGTIWKDQNGNPINWQPANLPNGIVFPPAYPFWYLAVDTNGDGEKDTIFFFASLGGTGYVIDCPNNLPPCNILSCRLTSNRTNRCYFVFSANGMPIKHYVLGSSDLANDNIDCMNLQNNQISNTTINVGGLNPGDRFQRVPHLIRIYETPIDNKTSWLTFDRIDLAVGCNDNESATYIGRIRRGSLLITPISQDLITQTSQNFVKGSFPILIGQNAVEVQADFVDENGNVAYRFRKVYAK
jgi:type II secretory pathway pseudopilin PulG